MKTLASLAVEISRDKELGLSNGQIESLILMIRSQHDLDKIWKMRPKELLEEIEKISKTRSFWLKSYLWYRKSSSLTS